jgi:trans-aconitate methyltransferase
MAKLKFNGAKYKKASKHQKEWGNKTISELRLNGDESILDLGCGDGILTKNLADLVPKGKVIGIDASEGMINEAKKLEKENLIFLLQDINELNCDNEFDLIFSNATLHWIKDHKKLLENCHKALKDKGYIRFDFAGDGNCQNFIAVVKEVMNEEQFQKYFTDYEWPWYMPKIDEYKQLAEQSKFKEVDVWGENKDRYFSNEQEMIGWIDQPSIVPFLKYIIEEKDQKEFRDIIVDRMITRTKQKEGTCFETFRRININARKSFSIP